MLIEEAIKRAKLSGMLMPVEAGYPWASKPRVFLMCAPLWEAIKNGRVSSDTKERQQWAALEARMQYFVEGGYIADHILKQLQDYKYEHWEFINRKPSPGIRVFGRFAKPDVFVGTHLQLRRLLGKMWSQEFEIAKLECEEHWRAAGLPDDPFPGAFTDAPLFRYETYVTENSSRKMRVPT